MALFKSVPPDLTWTLFKSLQYQILIRSGLATVNWISSGSATVPDWVQLQYQIWFVSKSDLHISVKLYDMALFKSVPPDLTWTLFKSILQLSTDLLLTSDPSFLVYSRSLPIRFATVSDLVSFDCLCALFRYGQCYPLRNGPTSKTHFYSVSSSVFGQIPSFRPPKSRFSNLRSGSATVSDLVQLQYQILIRSGLAAVNWISSGSATVPDRVQLQYQICLVQIWTFGEGEESKG
ncbi:hypothetical protein F511_11828 [Dorcoceras hygrometricum]|uniref:Uncharacterized protein n=1 Tax=Dorcoceras hygrometricum TaxID=472368 RepID=A0A2Z7ARQ6_9LAMI|nr:hypothetical protein F511_11828 [Dorcoceras hygrometricum]